MISTNDLKKGMTILLDGKICEVVDYQHVKRGRGGAFMRVRLRDIQTGLSVEQTFKGEQKVQQAFLAAKSMTYLYRDSHLFHFMDNEKYEQVSLPEEMLHGLVDFLSEGIEATFTMHDNDIVGVKLPDTIELEVKETSPGFKGDTVSGSSKPATLETGATIQVPFFIEVGDKVKVDTRTGAYLERVS